MRCNLVSRDDERGDPPRPFILTNQLPHVRSHGVMALAWTKESSEKDAKSILYERETTTLPLHLERLAVYSTAPVLGDYYRT